MTAIRNIASASASAITSWVCILAMLHGCVVVVVAAVDIDADPKPSQGDHDRHRHQHDSTRPRDSVQVELDISQRGHVSPVQADQIIEQWPRGALRCAGRPSDNGVDIGVREPEYTLHVAHPTGGLRAEL